MRIPSRDNQSEPDVTCGQLESLLKLCVTLSVGDVADLCPEFYLMITGNYFRTYRNSPNPCICMMVHCKPVDFFLFLRETTQIDTNVVKDLPGCKTTLYSSFIINVYKTFSLHWDQINFWLHSIDLARKPKTKNQKILIVRKVRNSIACHKLW